MVMAVVDSMTWEKSGWDVRSIGRIAYKYQYKLKAELVDNKLVIRFYHPFRTDSTGTITELSMASLRLASEVIPNDVKQRIKEVEVIPEYSSDLSLLKEARA
jgi:hypothetical protein